MQRDQKLKSIAPCKNYPLSKNKKEKKLIKSDYSIRYESFYFKACILEQNITLIMFGRLCN